MDIVGERVGPIPPAGEPARSRRLSILEGSFATIHIQITTGSLVTAYALWCGAQDFHLGLVAALTALSASGALFGAQWVGRLGRRKALCVGTSVGGRYFGVRNAIHAGVAMGAAWGSGRLFDHFIAADRKPEGLALIFGLAAISALIAGLLLSRQWEPPMQGDRSRPWRETIRLPLIEPGFRRLLLYFILFGGATGVASGFFAPQMIRGLEMPFSQIALYPIVAGTVSLISQPLWGRLCDRLGNRPVVVFCQAGWSGLPLLWLLATPDRLWPIWLDAALTGIYWPGFALATFNLLLASAPEEIRTACLGVHAFAVGVVSFLASLTGGVLAAAWAGTQLSAAGLLLGNYHMLFALSALLRFLLIPLAVRLPEDGARPVSALIGFTGDRAVQELQAGIHTGLEAVRRIGRPNGR